jgi:hypothetical protein
VALFCSTCMLGSVSLRRLSFLRLSSVLRAVPLSSVRLVFWFRLSVAMSSRRTAPCRGCPRSRRTCLLPASGVLSVQWSLRPVLSPFCFLSVCAVLLRVAICAPVLPLSTVFSLPRRPPLSLLVILVVFSPSICGTRCLAIFCGILSGPLSPCPFCMFFPPF